MLMSQPMTGSFVAKPARRFFLCAALLLALLAVIGFSRTYYLKALFSTPALSALLHIHAVIMSAWLSLLIVQAVLIANRRLRLHRRLGIAGAVLAALVVLVGMYATIMATELEVRNHQLGKFHFLLAINEPIY